MSEEAQGVEATDPEEAAADAAWDAFSTEGSRRGGRRGRGSGGATPAARRRLVFVLVLLTTVALVAVAVIVVVLHSGSSKGAANDGAATQVATAHTALVSHRRECPADADQLTCRRQTAESLSLAYRDFNIDLDRITLPPSATDARDTVEEDADLLSNAYDELSVAATNTTYERIFNRDDVTGLTETFDRHYAALVTLARAS